MADVRENGKNPHYALVRFTFVKLCICCVCVIRFGLSAYVLGRFLFRLCAFKGPVHAF